jgi:cold shock CspA family protein
METYTGTITYISRSKGFGFIRLDDSEETVFFHAGGCVSPPDFAEYREGHTVEFCLIDDKHGRSRRAIGVVIR